MSTKVMLATLAMVAGAASAQFFSEVESNNTLATANFVGSFSQPGGSVLIDGTITVGDVDWFSFTLNDTASLAVFAGFSNSSSADGVMQLVNSSGVVIAFDDDSGIGFMPALQVASLAAGTYYIGMSGFGDAGSSSVGTTNVFDGLGHQENFAYKLTLGVTVIPAPGAMALLGLGGLVATRRRR